MTEAALGALPVGSRGRNSLGWWGVLCLIATEASLFAYLLFSYAYLALQNGPGWSPEPHPSLALALPNTAVLLSSSVAVWWAERGIVRRKPGQPVIGLAVAIGLGVIFVTVQLFEWAAKPFGIASGAYGSLYFTITGFHMVHVVVGLLMLATVSAWWAMGYFDRSHSGPVAIVSAYWHFVDAVWIAVFSAFYIAPYLGLGS
jgi:heme/copper-type cytochrome/quinol oxidase subunit 3